MRSALVAISTVCLGITLVGCSNTNSNQDTTRGARPSAGSDEGTTRREASGWTLKLTSKCADTVNAADCIGFYGFSVDQQGHYQVGPGPNGELRTGNLKAEDLQSFSSLLSTTVGGGGQGSSGLSLSGSEEHVTMEAAAASEDLVTIANETTQAQKLIRTSGSDFYYTLKTADEAKTLYQGLRRLAEVYYAPMPFPDACEDGINSLQTLIANVTSCKQDSDCGYFDPSLNLVAADAQVTLALDNCARVLPLSVANIESVKTNQTKLGESWGQVVQACGERILRSDCTQRTGFTLNKTPATCQQGVCKAPSSLSVTEFNPR